MMIGGTLTMRNTLAGGWALLAATIRSPFTTVFRPGCPFACVQTRSEKRTMISRWRRACGGGVSSRLHRHGAGQRLRCCVDAGGTRTHVNGTTTTVRALGTLVGMAGGLRPPSTALRPPLALSSLAFFNDTLSQQPPPPPPPHNTSHRFDGSLRSRSSAEINWSAVAAALAVGGGVAIYDDRRATATDNVEHTHSNRWDATSTSSRILPHITTSRAGWPLLAQAVVPTWIVSTTTTACEEKDVVVEATLSRRKADATADPTPSLADNPPPKASSTAGLDSNDADKVNDNNADVEVDPYDNLPDRDEDTHCSMCNTFRQGPCRPQWRKLERCFKDHETEENGAVKCMKYFAPHQQCLQQYLNLYQLVSLHMKQELVHDTERAVTRDERQKWEVDIEWGLWKQFVQEQGPNWKQTIRQTDEHSPGKDLLPLWKRLPENTEPVLLTLHSPLPQHKNGMILKIAYAVDQDGFVLGFSYNPAYQALLEQSLKSAAGNTATAPVEADGPAASTPPPPGASDSSDPTGAAKLAPTDNADPFRLEFVLFPGETHSIQICAMYSENPVTASPEKDLLDVILYTSPPRPVSDGAR